MHALELQYGRRPVLGCWCRASKIRVINRGQKDIVLRGAGNPNGFIGAATLLEREIRYFFFKSKERKKERKGCLPYR